MGAAPCWKLLESQILEKSLGRVGGDDDGGTSRGGERESKVEKRGQARPPRLLIPATPAHTPQNARPHSGAAALRRASSWS